MSAELNETEREALRGFVRGGSHSPSYGYDTQTRALHATVERILAEHETALRESIAAEIELQVELFEIGARAASRELVRLTYLSCADDLRVLHARIARGATS